jgi:hypothetical protein
MLSERFPRGIPIIRYVAYLTVMEPGLLVSEIAGITALALIAWGLEPEFDGTVLVTLRFFGSISIKEVPFFVGSLLPQWIELLVSLFLFCCMSLAGSRWLGLLHDPVTGLLLAQCTGRGEAFVWTLCGLAGAVGSVLMVFYVAVAALLVARGIPFPACNLALGFASLMAWGILVFAWACLVAFLTEHPMSVLLLLVMIFFVIGPMLEGIQPVGRPLLWLLCGVLPPTHSLGEWTAKVVLGKDVPVLPLGPLVVTPLACLFLGYEAFRRRDL